MIDVLIIAVLVVGCVLVIAFTDRPLEGEKGHE